MFILAPLPSGSPGEGLDCHALVKIDGFGLVPARNRFSPNFHFGLKCRWGNKCGFIVGLPPLPGIPKRRDFP